MKTVLKLLGFGITAIIFFLYVANGMKFLKPAETLQTKNENSAETLVSNFIDKDKTQYDDADIGGNALLDVIDAYSNDSTMEIIVITLASASKSPVAAVSYTEKDTSEYTGKLTYSSGSTTGTVSITISKKYSITDINDTNYINPSGNFHGTVKYNTNNNINAIIFQQTS